MGRLNANFLTTIMNVEENRLQTFTNWPANAAVESARVAKGGFFFTGVGLEVQCFSCGGKISDWNYGDQVMGRHRLLNPNCRFVLNSSTSGNIPLTPSRISTPTVSHTASTSSIPSAVVDRDDMSIEEHRLATFEKWPATHIVTPDRLAKAGFYYLNEIDKVKCFTCNGIVVSWEVGDDPVQEHKRHFPLCTFINDELVQGNGDGNKITASRNARVISQNNYKELGLQVHKGPHQAKYATLESRLRSFTGWPEDIIQRPEALSEAGFYYTGLRDQVRCFHCDVGLRRWDPQDEPWREHARWFPNCAFLLLAKGQSFIDTCDQARTSSNLCDTVSRNLGSVPFMGGSVSETDLQIMMKTSMVAIALSIGLPAESIQQAIRQKIERTGTPFGSADTLIEATLNLVSETGDNSASDFVDDFTRINLEDVPSPDKLPSSAKDSTNLNVANISSSGECSQTAGVKTLSLEEENRRLKEARLCKICLDLEVGVVFLPCGHLATCINCASNLKDCPVCRSSIKAFVRTFLS